MSKHYETKQVILMRTDLRTGQGQKVRSGKLMAQAAHASMIWLSKRVQDQIEEELNAVDSRNTDDSFIADPLRYQFSVAELSWLKGSFAKIVLGVDSLEQLTELVGQAQGLSLAAHIVTDAGMTEFGGVSTVTCGAIGPATSEIIDRITGHLKPL